MCISEELVDNNCFGPEIHNKLDTNEIHLPLATESVKQKQPPVEVNTISNIVPASHPKETETPANGGHWVDLVRPKYDPSSEPTSSPSVGTKSFWTNTENGNDSSNAWQWEIHQFNAAMQIFSCNPFMIISLASLIIHT